jgi:UDP-2,4-diacetamido-2,4,6-trideoxy-beta-L-altropyranose hydrolase
MRVAFRVDASLSIGSGHVMRCLALADRLKNEGSICQFVVREHAGHMGDAILERGHGLSLLSPIAPMPDVQGYAAWLGTDWQTDSIQTLKCLESNRLDWVVVDHYALDARWETSVQGSTEHLLVIDDLADRPHCCDLLLDQNLGRGEHDYVAYNSERKTRQLIGPQYALMRPGFSQLREMAISRRLSVAHPASWLISLGGVDAGNVTGQMLEALAQLPDARFSSIDVVLGKHAPHQDTIRTMLLKLDIPCKLHVDTSAMAELAAQADVAIGAAGVSAWERCSLGLPSLLVELAENQRSGGLALDNAGAAMWLGKPDRIADELSRALQRLKKPGAYREMQICAAAVTDGRGTDRVAAAMKQVLQ